MEDGKVMVAMVEDVLPLESDVASAALAERLFQSTLATLDIATVFLGHRLGM